MTPEAGKIIANKYRLDTPLAEGGMGAVWVAMHLDLEVEVAIKFMVSDLADNEVIRNRFKREARAAAKLKGPNIAQIHDYGVHEGAPYIAMELLDGEDLDDLLQRAGTLPIERVVDIVTQVCRGLKLAHDAGIVHRDLKPSNIFVAKSGDQEVVKVLDFGIAKETAPERANVVGTESGVLVGSPRYMSPEQATGETLDQRSDLWSVAVVAFELITGVSPFNADNLGKVITLICSRDIAPPSSHDPSLSQDIDDFFERAFARDPAGRFQSAIELAEALACVARGEPLPDIATDDTDEVPPNIGGEVSRRITPRTDATEEVATPSQKVDKTTPMLAEATTVAESVDGKKEDGTSPGVGLDSGSRDDPQRKRSTAPLLLGIAAAAAVGVAVVAFGNGTATDSDQTGAEPVASQTAASPTTPAMPGLGTSSASEPTAPRPNASEHARATPPSAHASTKPGDPDPTVGVPGQPKPVAKEARTRPRPRAVAAPKPVVRPKPKPAPKTDGTFGLPSPQPR